MKSYNLAGTEIQMPDLVRTGAPGEAEHAFAVALDAANLFASQKHAVENDQHLSTTGKQAKLAPMASQLWKTIFSSAKALQGERLKIETRTAELYGIGVPTTPYQIQQDLERRTWWNAQPAANRAAFLEAVSRTPEESMLLALLRSPVPAFADLELRALREAFEALRRESDADLWALISDDQHALDWALRGMGHVVGISHGLTGITRQGVLAMLVESGDIAAAVALDYSQAEIATERRIQSAKRLAA